MIFLTQSLIKRNRTWRISKLLQRAKLLLNKYHKRLTIFEILYIILNNLSDNGANRRGRDILYMSMKINMLLTKTISLVLGIRSKIIEQSS